MTTLLSTHINLAFFSNIRPILGCNTRFPIKIHSQRFHRVVIHSPEASHVISSLHCSKRKLPRLNAIPVVIVVPIRRSHLTQKKRRKNQKQNYPLTEKYRTRSHSILGMSKFRFLLLQYPDGESVGIWQRLTLVGANDLVLANGHGIALDILGDAFGVPGLDFKSQGFGWGRKEDQEKKRKVHKGFWVWTHHYHNHREIEVLFLLMRRRELSDRGEENLIMVSNWSVEPNKVAMPTTLVQRNSEEVKVLILRGGVSLDDTRIIIIIIHTRILSIRVHEEWVTGKRKKETRWK